MESLMHIGNFVSKETNDNLKDIIASILGNTHQMPEVIIKALDVVENAYHVDNIVVSGGTFYAGEKKPKVGK